MNLILIRNRFKAQTIDGHLYIDGFHICDTAENALTALPCGTYSVSLTYCQRKLRKMAVINIDNADFGMPNPETCQTCANLHQCRRNIELNLIESLFLACHDDQLALEQLHALDISRSYDTRSELRAMPEHNCPHFAPGNGAYNLTDGSILVGRYLQPGILFHSRKVYNSLYNRIRKQLARKQNVTLIISESAK